MKLQPVLLEQIKEFNSNYQEASFNQPWNWIRYLLGFVDDDDDVGAVLADKLEQVYVEFEKSESSDRDQDCN